MKKRKIPFLVLSSILAIGVVGITMFTYVNYVRQSLWNQAVNDILDSTTQEQESFQLSIEKDIENLTTILNSVSLENETVIGSIMEHSSLNGYNLIYIDLNEQTYLNRRQKEKLLDEEVDLINNLSLSKGITKPYLNRINGERTIASYVKFEDKLLVKEAPVEYIAEQFSLSFYNDLGFSYIIDDSGNVLMRNNHKNSNRTMQNLFDIIDIEGNDQATIQSFENALLNHQKGYALFNYHDNTNVFCYTPITILDGWYIVSIIPNDIIMTQANNIIIFTIILSVIIVGAIGVILLLYRYNRRQHKNEVEYLAYFDTLTNLYNYQKFKEEGNRKLNQDEKKWAVIYSDIAGFKIINDLNGYEFGDKILKELAKIIQNTISLQSLSCHMTADKFLMMCDYQEKQDLAKICESIYQQLYTILKKYGLEKESVIKFGICCLEDDEIHNIEGLVDRSHLALNEVSSNLKDYYCFYNYSMRERMMKEADIETKMENALKNREFVFYLQPKYNVLGNQILGAEALVRWIDHTGTMIMPGDFIPIFEKNGFILKLDEYVFEKVCQYLSDRIQKNYPVVSISINVSRLHFYQPDFIDRYVNIKEKYQIPDGLLELEVTENVLLDDMKKIQEIISQLQCYGFSCSIDDFGSGYSSLNSLKDLSFDVIKLDKLFLDNSVNSQRSEEIIKSIIDMAKHIEIKTVAEGVETQKQLAFLKKTDCDMIQGYIFSKPLPIHEFEDILKDSQRLVA